MSSKAKEFGYGLLIFLFILGVIMLFVGNGMLYWDDDFTNNTLGSNINIAGYVLMGIPVVIGAIAAGGGGKKGKGKRFKGMPNY